MFHGGHRDKEKFHLKILTNNKYNKKNMNFWKFILSLKKRRQFDVSFHNLDSWVWTPSVTQIDLRQTELSHLTELTRRWIFHIYVVFIHFTSTKTFQNFNKILLDSLCWYREHLLIFPEWPATLGRGECCNFCLQLVAVLLSISKPESFLDFV